MMHCCGLLYAMWMFRGDHPDHFKIFTSLSFLFLPFYLTSQITSESISEYLKSNFLGGGVPHYIPPNQMVCYHALLKDIQHCKYPGHGETLLTITTKFRHCRLCVMLSLPSICRTWLLAMYVAVLQVTLEPIVRL